MAANRTGCRLVGTGTGSTSSDVPRGVTGREAARLCEPGRSSWWVAQPAGGAGGAAGGGPGSTGGWGAAAAGGAAGGAWGAAAAAAGAAATAGSGAPTEVPHSAQKRAPGAISEPQLVQNWRWPMGW